MYLIFFIHSSVDGDLHCFHVLAMVNSAAVKIEVHTYSVMSESLQPHRLLPTRFLCPWDYPGKNTGVGCHFLLQGIFLTQGSNLHLLHWQEYSITGGKHQALRYLYVFVLRFSSGIHPRVGLVGNLVVLFLVF